jgi:hypothetical protein
MVAEILHGRHVVSRGDRFSTVSPSVLEDCTVRVLSGLLKYVPRVLKLPRGSVAIFLKCLCIAALFQLEKCGFENRGLRCYVVFHSSLHTSTFTLSSGSSLASLVCTRINVEA